MNKNFFKRPSVIVTLVVAAIFSLTQLVHAKRNDVPVTRTPKTNTPQSKDAPVTTAATEVSAPIVATDQEVRRDAPPAIQEKEPVNEKIQDVPAKKPEPVDSSWTSSLVSAVKSAVGLDNSATATTKPIVSTKYPVHTNVTTTLFWAGEEAGDDNKDISNLPSAWDEKWVKHFGGIDTPKKRNGSMPAGFTPDENPFYFALPYNDFNEKGNRKKDVESVIPWAKDRVWKDNESILKNQWIKITKGDKVAYAQWEDVGPFKEDDSEYVFGTAEPESKTNKHAGLDVSPAVNDMLGLSDIDTTDWQFVDATEVPDGPWKKIVTTSQIYWK